VNFDSSTFSKGKSRKPVFISHCATAQDTSISLEARGLLYYYISLPADWKVKATHIKRENSIGREKFQKLNTELINAGYLIRWQEKKSNGRYGAYFYEAFYDKKEACERLKELANEVSYEQNRLAAISSLNEKKRPHSIVSPKPEKRNVDSDCILIVSTNVDTKEDTYLSYQKDKIENPQRSHVHNSKRDCKQVNTPKETHSHKKKKEPVCHDYQGSGFAGASYKAKKTAKDYSEPLTIQALQEEFPEKWDQIDSLTKGISWMQLCHTLFDCKRAWGLAHMWGDRINNKFAYYIASLKRYIENLKDSSLNPVLACLESMA